MSSTRFLLFHGRPDDSVLPAEFLLAGRIPGMLSGYYREDLTRDLEYII